MVAHLPFPCSHIGRMLSRRERPGGVVAQAELEQPVVRFDDFRQRHLCVVENPLGVFQMRRVGRVFGGVANPCFPGFYSAFNCRKGLVIRSWPMLDPAPWPQMKPTSSPSGRSFVLIELIRVA